MKQIFSKKWLLTFSFIAAAIAVTIACADWEIPFSHSSNFSPEVNVDKGYGPLFYDPYNYFYDIGYDDQHNNRFNDDIVKDWYGFLQKKMTEENINFLLINDDAESVLENLNDYYQKNSKSETAKEWSKHTNLKNKKVKAFIQFTYLARQVDKVAAPEINYWYYGEDTEEDTENTLSQQLLNTLLKKYQTTSDSFLKNRYWFQYLKALFYAKESIKFEDFFNKTKANEPQNTLYYRALGYLAGLKYNEEKYKESNLLYATILDKLPAMSPVVMNSFYLQDEEEWSENLKLAKSKEDKAALWTVLGYLKDEERAIKEIYKIDPRSKHLNLLLTRLINKKEDHSTEFFYTNENAVGFFQGGNDDFVDEQLYQSLLKIASEEQTANPYLWHIAIGYINSWQDKCDVAKNHYRKAEKFLSKKNRLAQKQLHLLKVLNEVKSIKAIKGNNVEEMVDELSWLYSKGGNDKADLRFEYAIKESKKYLSDLYKANNNPLYAELFAHEDEYYKQPENIDKTINFLQKEDKTAFEKLLATNYSIPIEALYHHKAVIAVFNDDIDDAINNMMNAEDLANTVLLGNPFNGFIQDCHDCDHARPQTIKYTSLDLLLKMQELKLNIEQNKDLYNNSLLLGNAFYNITFYGNARLFSENQLTGDVIPSDPTYVISFGQEMLTNCDLAKKNYQKALLVATNDEQAAKATYMIAKCERNEYYNSQYDFGKQSSKHYPYDPTSVGAGFSYGWDSFKILHKKYKDTQYYKDVISECGYFKIYVNSVNSK